MAKKKTHVIKKEVDEMEEEVLEKADVSLDEITDADTLRAELKSALDLKEEMLNKLKELEESQIQERRMFVKLMESLRETIGNHVKYEVELVAQLNLLASNLNLKPVELMEVPQVELRQDEEEQQ